MCDEAGRGLEVYDYGSIATNNGLVIKVKDGNTSGGKAASETENMLYALIQYSATAY